MNNDHDTDKMRDYMSASESYATKLGFDREALVENTIVEGNNFVPPLQADLLDLVQRLRMFTESSGGDYALGFESGMQRAAEMIENLLDSNFEDR